MKLLVGGLIATILLGIYAYSVVEAIRLALVPNPPDMSSGHLLALTTIGGLVSALVIAELAISKPGEIAGIRASDESNGIVSRAANSAAPFVIITYIVVWTVLGASAFVVGVMEFPGKVQSLTDFGQSWLGLAVAAGYAYFGLSR